MDPIRPFRWDIAGGAALGDLLPDRPLTAPPFAAEVLRCAARVLALSADGEVQFVGRSMDSMFDLLSGALAGSSWENRLAILPVSLHHTQPSELDVKQLAQVRANLSASDLTPRLLARRRRPVVFVDLVASGGTFGAIYELVRDWAHESGAQWDVIRLKMRFVGVTSQERTSPNTWRWHQNAEWTSELPKAAIKNVSMNPRVWQHLGGLQSKASVSFRPSRWLDDSVRQPRRDEEGLRGLAEAVAMFEYGQANRSELARRLADEHAFREPWLRALASELR